MQVRSVLASSPDLFITNLLHYTIYASVFCAILAYAYFLEWGLNEALKHSYFNRTYKRDIVKYLVLVIRLHLSFK